MSHVLSVLWWPMSSLIKFRSGVKTCKRKHPNFHEQCLAIVIVGDVVWKLKGKCRVLLLDTTIFLEFSAGGFQL